MMTYEKHCEETDSAPAGVYKVKAYSINNSWNLDFMFNGKTFMHFCPKNQQEAEHDFEYAKSKLLTSH